MDEAFNRRWLQLSQEVSTGMHEWRLAHRRATLNEIEAALDERLGWLRAQMLQDAALASAASAGGTAGEEVSCPACGGSRSRRVSSRCATCRRRAARPQPLLARSSVAQVAPQNR